MSGDCRGMFIRIYIPNTCMHDTCGTSRFRDQVPKFLPKHLSITGR